MGAEMASQRLLICARVARLGGEVCRGMAVRAAEGTAVGVVAAVAVGADDRVSHVLLGQVPPTAVYYLVPLALLDRLEGACLWLRAPAAAVARLPVHRPGARAAG